MEVDKYFKETKAVNMVNFIYKKTATEVTAYKQSTIY